MLQSQASAKEVGNTVARIALARVSAGDAPMEPSIVSSERNMTVATLTIEELVRALGNSLEYDVVILEVSVFKDNEIEAFNSVRNLAPNLPIIVISEALEDNQVRSLMKLQPADWLKKPVQPSDLDGAVSAAIKQNRASSNKVHAVVPVTGGAGATTISVAMADLLTRRLGKTSASIGLVDLDFSQGNCALLTNLVNQTNLQSAISNPKRIDQEFVQLIQSKHEDGFFVYSYKRRELVTHENIYETVLRLLDAASSIHTHTIVDIPVHETEWRNDLLQTVNTVTLVCELNLPSLKQCIDVLEALRKRKDGLSTVNLLINKRVSGLFSPQRIKRNQVADLLGDVSIHYLPYEPSTTFEAMDRGQMLTVTNPSSKLVASLLKYIDMAIIPKVGAK